MGGKQQFASYNHFSKTDNIKSGVPQGGILSSTLLNIYLFDIPLLSKDSVKITTYADEITSSHVKFFLAVQQLQFYLRTFLLWTMNNNLQMNTSKITATPLPFNPAGYKQNSQSPQITKLSPTLKTQLFKKFGPKLT